MFSRLIAPRWCVLVFTLSALTTVPMCSHATGFSVSPIIFEFGVRDRTEVLSVESSVDERKAFEVTVVRWTQVDGKDVLEPTEDFIVTPPAFNLLAREKRMLRIVRTEAPPEADEARYRLLLKEIPLFENRVQGRPVLSITASVPIFVLPIQPVQPRFNVTVSKNTDGEGYTIKVVNVGNTHGKFVSAQPVTNNTPVGEPLALGGYVLDRKSVV